jgi:hypothetical protein
MKRLAILTIAVLSFSANAQNALTDWEMGWSDLDGQDQFNQYHGQDQWDWSQVPAEFGYDTNWNGEFKDTVGNGNGLCAQAISNNISASVDGAGNTLILNATQDSIGDQSAKCIWTENYYGEGI